MSVIPHLYDLERPFRLMAPEFFRPDFFHSPFNQLVPRQLFSSEQLFKPWENMLRPFGELMRPTDQLSAAMNQLGLEDVSTNIISDNEKFQVSVDVQHFAPEEINVKVIDRQVIVEGKHEERRDEHGFVSRQFVRKYALPEGCLPDTVQSSLSSDGVLTVTAPKVLALPSQGERIIPITHTGPISRKVGFEPIKQEDLK